MSRLDAVEERLVVVGDSREEEACLGGLSAERLGTGVERLGDGVGGIEVVAVSGGDDHGSSPIRTVTKVLTWWTGFVEAGSGQISPIV